jgi:hypothetical protein
MRPGDGTFVLRWNNHQESMRKDRKLIFSVACSDPVSGAFLTPGFGSGMEKNLEPVFGKNISYLILENSVSVFQVKNTKIL